MLERLPKLLRLDKRPLDDRDGDDVVESGDDSDMIEYWDCGAAKGEKAVLSLRRDREE